MSIKTPRNKIQASFAGFEFTCKELIYLQNNFNWKTLRTFPDATLKKDNDIHTIIITLRLSVFSYHIEIMKQSLYEYRENIILKQSPLKYIEHINELVDFLSYLRNALLHAEGELIPRWNIKTKHFDTDRLNRLQKFIDLGFSANIPIIKESHGYRFQEKSNSFISLTFKIKLTKEIKIDDKFINKLRLLSWHVLTIAKKQNNLELSKYLDHTINAKPKAKY